MGALYEVATKIKIWRGAPEHDSNVEWFLCLRLFVVYNGVFVGKYLVGIVFIALAMPHHERLRAMVLNYRRWRRRQMRFWHIIDSGIAA